MEQTQTTSEPQTYPDRVYNGKDFEPNLNMEQSSDNLTTVLTDKNEVLGFPDHTSKQEMQAAIEADRNGSISTYKPSFYDKFIRQPLENLGMASFQPPFITDIKPSPVRAFATSMAEAATAGIFKPEFAQKEAQAFPKEAMAGGLVGGLASFATGGALLDGFKLSQLTPFAEGIVKTGLLGGAYRGVQETSEQLRDTDHPDLAKIGTGVLHDTLWFGAMGATAPLAKTANVAASAGLGYLMAKTDGQDEPSALLNGALFGGIQILHAGGDSQEVRTNAMVRTERLISDYIQAKNPLVHEEVANQAGREMVANYAQDVVDKWQAQQAEAKEGEVAVQRMESEGGNPIETVTQNPEMTLQTISSIAKDSHDILEKQEVSNAESGRGSTQEGSVKEGVEGQATVSNDLRNDGTTEKGQAGEEVTQETQGEQVTSKIAKSIEQKAVDANLTDKFPTLAGEEKVNVAEQSKLATDTVNSNIDDARAMIRGEKPLPGKLRGISLITAMEEHLKNNPDPDIAYELANSPLVSATTRAAQELRLAAEREPDSFTAKMNELKQAILDSKGGDKNISKDNAKMVKNLKTESSKVNLSKDELKWDKFLDTIQC